MNADELTRRPPSTPGLSAREQEDAVRRFDTRELFRGSAEIEIVHEGAVYRLKITRQGKLILNK